MIFLIISAFIFHERGLNLTSIKDFGKKPYAPFVYIFLFISASFVPIPFMPLTWFGATIFPFYYAVFYALIGNMLLAIIMFTLSRYLGRDYMAKWEKKSRRLEDLDVNFKKNAFKDIFFLRLFFFIPPEFVNIMAGLSKVKFRDFFFASLAALIPVVFNSILFVESKLNHDTGLFIISILIYLIILLIPIVYVTSLKNFLNKKYDKIKTKTKKRFSNNKINIIL